MTDKDYDQAYDKMYLKEKNAVVPEDASRWIYSNIYGKITPE